MSSKEIPTGPWSDVQWRSLRQDEVLAWFALAKGELEQRAEEVMKALGLARHDDAESDDDADSGSSKRGRRGKDKPSPSELANKINTGDFPRSRNEQLRASGITPPSPAGEAE